MCSVQKPIRPSSIVCKYNKLEIDEKVSSIRVHRVLPNNGSLYAPRNTRGYVGRSPG